jgi:hypothetical protein
MLKNNPDLLGRSGQKGIFTWLQHAMGVVSSGPSELMKHLNTRYCGDTV